MASQENWQFKRKHQFDRGSNGGNKRFRGDGGPSKDVLSAAPRELRILDYVKSHVAEIKHLQAAVEIDMSGKTTLQKLPRHLQRRAMSHNIKRMPRSVRGYAKVQYANKPAKKKPSRYHRRRPKNLLQEYSRRQQEHVWLETHIWHAKRFHMVDAWGYRLPLRPTEKSERACYRATTQHTLLQDMSYMSCIEITGNETVLLDSLSHITSTSTGSTFAAKSCLSGTREGHTVVYQCDTYPEGAIAPVTFMWRPMALTSDQMVTITTSQRKLWVWCHPGCFSLIWDEFKKCLHLEEVGVVGSADCSGSPSGKPASDDVTEEKEQKTKSKKKEIRKAIIEIKKVDHDIFKTKCSAVNQDQKTTMKSLTGSVLRYCLTGPQSSSVLFDALQQSSVKPQNTDDLSTVWWKCHYAQEGPYQAHIAQRETIEKFSLCQSPAELPRSCVVGLTVGDPRLTRPERRTKVVAQETAISQDMSACRDKVSPEVASSPLWENSIRDQVTASKISDHDINRMKAEHLVPGTSLQLGDQESRIPVILIQRPGVTSTTSAQLGHCCGWDIVLPRGWGMPFWLTLVFRGARCGGLRESQNIAFEGKSLQFPDDYPDTQTGRTEMEKAEKAAVQKYNRRPPAKRTNYVKYGVIAPFIYPWKHLVKEWCYADEEIQKEQKETRVQNELEKKKVDEIQLQKVNGHQSDSTEDRVSGETFYVIRDTKLLRRLQNFSENSLPGNHSVKVQLEKVNKSFRDLSNQCRCGLMPILIDMVHKGSAGQFSMICIPSTEDMQKLEMDKAYGGPLEPQHVDQAQIDKKKMKKEFKEKNIKKRVKVDRVMKVLDEMENVRVRNCSRDVIGYLTAGGFSLGSGYGAGKGFVSAKGFVELVKSSGGPEKFKWLVLVRSTSSLQYRFARLSILI